MKKVISLIMAICLMFSFVVCVSAAKELYTLKSQMNAFVISSNGVATIQYGYEFDASTTGVTVNVLLEKRTVIFFWKDVESWTITCSDSYLVDVIQYQLTKSGTYRCTIVYEVTNTDGTTETHEYQKEVEYDPA